MEANHGAVTVGISRSSLKLRRKKKRQLNLWCWLFLSMSLVFYLLFMGWPIVSSFYYSMLKWSGLTQSGKFIALKNYQALFSDTVYWNAFWDSFKYTLIAVPCLLVISLLLAYILNNEQMRGRNIYRTAYFVPVVTTTSVVGIVMIFIWSAQGPINEVLLKLGMAGSATSFLGDGGSAFPTLIAVSVWKDCGTYMIYWLAGLQSVGREQYEAASIDGAGRWSTFTRVVFPQVLPTAGVIAILCTINALKIFDLIKTMTNGGPFYKTDVVATWVYRTAFSSELGMPRMGYASAGALLFGLVVIAIGLILNLLKARLQKNR
ncbi:MAG: sugar ABC transporter permease [Clostridiales bacterium]|nr:sugar ABC transporter permease [Clostridiales bacterium]